ncbi:outer membrane protein OmpK [Colwellia sp. C1TZA3]|uniref:outer membrane protein OmpK n=1 Tax=Colwellia sp. C1TZA3 TaxID=2508879 RepID=UPI0011B9CBCE|nr:outer membrane protein OmpK [Colwellia sp. C1TZA3]TWX71176.1 hypothetical protein ESZ39_09970 [Colwellia sp. C1TZA3]
MNKITTAIATSTLLVGLVGAAVTAHASVWSSTKVEGLYGQDYARGFNGADKDEAIFTFANATGFTWGDTYLFVDVTNINHADDTSGTHLEFGPRYRFFKPENNSVVKGVYGIVQADMTSNRFTTKIVKMAGASLDWNIPGFKFVKTHVQYRNDPTKEGSSVQFNLVWNKSFTISDQNFSFEGFLDWTSGEGEGFGSESNVLVQPQLLWHANKSLAVGVEYQYWKNRLGIEGRDESVPQIMVRWTF